jgi:integrase
MKDIELLIKEKSANIDEIAYALPALPKILRYYDSFEDRLRSIVGIDKKESVVVFFNGLKANIHFDRFDDKLSFVLKNLFVFMLSEDLNLKSISSNIESLKFVDTNIIINLITCHPTDVANEWVKIRSENLQPQVYQFLKSLLRMLMAYRIGGWSIDYIHLLKALPMPAKDKYAGLRSGDVFLSVNEEAILVGHIDRVSQDLQESPETIPTEILIEVSMLLFAYQFGMRPLQIAWVRMSDVRLWNKDEDKSSVHITFRMIKQKSTSKVRPLTRKIKFEWCCIVRELYLRRQKNNATGKDKLLDAKSGQEAGSQIAQLLGKLISGGATATDLRHTAALRLVDAGASKEELAEFLGQSDVNTCLVYFTASANQNERVNKALGISDIYSSVARISRDKYISVDELSRLKDEQQIAGVPHGIPIAGIGGCSSGQPLCPSNPILACYGCHKFMPVHEIGIHEQVLDDFRNIINTFRGASRDEQSSPAFLQLQHTISSVQAIIEEIKGLSL